MRLLIKKVCIIMFFMLFAISITSNASALSWSYTNDTYVNLDNSGSFPPPNGWFQLNLPSWYDARYVTSFTLSMCGYDNNEPSSPIDVWITLASNDRSESNSIQISSFLAPYAVPFGASWTLPVDFNNNTLDYSYFTGATSFYIGFGCHFSHGWSTVQIETVPEPTTMLLLGLGLVGIAAVRRRK